MATKVERNKEIYEDRMAGLKFREIGDKYGLSYNCARQLFVQEKKKEERKQSRLYNLLASLSDNREFVTRTYNVLTRNNLDTKEAILNVTPKELRKCRNCGKVMIDLIMQMADILRKEDIVLE